MNSHQFHLKYEHIQTLQEHRRFAESKKELRQTRVRVITSSLGDSRKYPYLYHRWLFGIPRVRGILWTEIPKAWGFQIWDFWRGKRGSVLLENANFVEFSSL